MSGVSIGRFRGGFCVYWHEADGRRRRYHLAARDRKAAEAEALDVYRRETLTRGDPTVATLWAEYRAHLGNRPTGKTVEYTGIPILEHFGALRPDQIEVHHCRSYAAKRKKQGIKVGSAWTELGHLRSCLNWSAKVRAIERAPYIELPQKPAPKERHLSRDEIARILETEMEPHLRVAILLLLTTAGRVGAVLGLTWDRVNLERRIIVLREDLEGPRKGRATIPINNTLMAALTAAKAAALSEFVVEWGGDRVGSIRKGFKAVCDRAGVKNVTPHVLRHTAAVHMAEAGIPMEEIAQYLGHSSIETTRTIYARFSPGYLSKAAAVLEFGTIKEAR
jgi:integrase